MYLGDLGQCISVAFLWWDGDRNQRLGFLKGVDGVRFAALRMELGLVGLSTDLSADWELVWAGDWLDFRAVVSEVFALMIMEDFFNATPENIQAGQFGGDQSAGAPAGGDGSGGR